MSRKRDRLQNLVPAPRPTYDHPSLARLQYAQPSSVQLLDGVIKSVVQHDTYESSLLFAVQNIF